MDMNNWTIISSIATTLGFFIISVSAIVALYQFIEMNKARTLEAFMRFLDELSTSESIEARRYVYNHELPPLDQIKPGTEIYAQVHKAYTAFDEVGIIVDKKLISESIVIEMYGEP